MTLRNAPLLGQDGLSYSLICISEKQNYFCRGGWTGQIRLIRLNKFDLRRKSGKRRMGGAQRYPSRQHAKMMTWQAPSRMMARISQNGYSDGQQCDGFRKCSTHSTRLELRITVTARRADWSRRRNPPFADHEEAGYAFGSNPPYGLQNQSGTIFEVWRYE
jgi:hypothetical protein